MAIPEAQLDTWSHQGSITQSRATYATIKLALEDQAAPFAQKSFTIFLQGSYGNDTNIYADSDVDLVARLDSAFYHDLSRLDDEQRGLFRSAHNDASYGLNAFKSDVTKWLTHKFGASVQTGNKAIYIAGNGSRRDADVLPAIRFRRYYKFNAMSDQRYADGICFLLPSGERIENYPKQHSENCTAKHQATAQWFKPVVRIFKNMRNRLIELGSVEEGLAPSYYLEGLLYNVPNNTFGVSYADTVAGALNWLLSADRSQFVCANQQFYLLRDGSPVTWRDEKCLAFVNAAVHLWNTW